MVDSNEKKYIKFNIERSQNIPFLTPVLYYCPLSFFPLPPGKKETENIRRKVLFRESPIYFYINKVIKVCLAFYSLQHSKAGKNFDSWGFNN